MNSLLVAGLFLVVAQTGPSQTATVYVYRYNQFVGKAVRPSVYCDDRELARIQAGRQFAVSLEPGRHVFRSNDAQAVVTFEAKPGETYYLRVEMAQGFVKAHGRLVLVLPEQGSEEVRRLDPSDRDMVRDVEHVTTKAVDGAPPTRSPAVAVESRSKDNATPLSNDDVVKLVKAGLGDAAVIAKIRSSMTAFQLDPDDLVALKTAGVSSEIIEAMISAKP